MGFDGLDFETGKKPATPKLMGIDKAIADMVGKIAALKRRNAGWDTSSLQRELDALRAKKGN